MKRSEQDGQISRQSYTIRPTVMLLSATAVVRLLETVVASSSSVEESRAAMICAFFYRKVLRDAFCLSKAERIYFKRAEWCSRTKECECVETRKAKRTELRLYRSKELPFCQSLGNIMHTCLTCSDSTGSLPVRYADAMLCLFSLVILLQATRENNKRVA